MKPYVVTEYDPKEPTHCWVVPLRKDGDPQTSGNAKKVHLENLVILARNYAPWDAGMVPPQHVDMNHDVLWGVQGRVDSMMHEEDWTAPRKD